MMTVWATTTVFNGSLQRSICLTASGPAKARKVQIGPYRAAQVGPIFQLTAGSATINSFPLKHIFFDPLQALAHFVWDGCRIPLLSTSAAGSGESVYTQEYQFDRSSTNLHRCRISDLGSWRGSGRFKLGHANFCFRTGPGNVGLSTLGR
jgi:hypothetical protein